MLKKTCSAASVLLSALLLAVLLTGCLTPERPVAPTGEPRQTGASASETGPVPELPTETALPVPESHPTGLIRLENCQPEEGEYPVSAAISGDHGILLLERWDENAKTVHRRLALIDGKTGASDGMLPLEDSALPSAVKLIPEQDRITLIDPAEQQAAVYDWKGRLEQLCDNPVADPDQPDRQNRIADASFWKEPYFSRFTDSSDPNRVINLLAFYDRDDAIYSISETFDNCLDCQDRKLLVVHALDGGKSLQCKLLDVDGGACTDTVTISAEPEWRDNVWLNASLGCLGENWSILLVERVRDAHTDFIPYLWYPSSDNQTPMETEVLTEEGLHTQVEQLCRELEDAYGVTFHLDEAPDPSLTPIVGLEDSMAPGENLCETGASLVGQYRILRDLRQFFGVLPQGFIPELYSQMPGEEAWNRETLHIYLVRSIPGDSSAFANAWAENMTVCFATEEYARNQLPHEFMHLMDYRISQYMFQQDRNFETEWWDLSPDYAYDTDLTESQQEETAEYFVSSYARTNAQEDRAETFQNLFTCLEPLDEAWWYADRPHIQEKVRCLIRAIREAFPSVQAQDRAVWEKIDLAPSSEP